MIVNLYSIRGLRGGNNNTCNGLECNCSAISICFLWREMLYFLKRNCVMDYFNSVVLNLILQTWAQMFPDIPEKDPNGWHESDDWATSISGSPVSPLGDLEPDYKGSAPLLWLSLSPPCQYARLYPGLAGHRQEGSRGELKTKGHRVSAAMAPRLWYNLPMEVCGVSDLL